MKKIGIDARLINQTGVGVYIRNLLFYLDKKNLDFLFYIYLLKDDFEKINFNNRNFVKKQTSSYWHSMLEQIDFLHQINRDQLDLMHFTYFSYPIFYHKPFIATIHDLTPLLFRTGKSSTKNPLIYNLKHFFFKQILFAQINNAEVLITPCETVKKQILKYYGTKYQNKILPIYEGIDYQITGSKSNDKLKNQFHQKFFIYVGNFYPHKNVERLICAFSKVDSPIQLILLGPDDYFSKRLTQLINKLSQDKRIIFFKNPTRKDLVFFYKNALGLIHPSLSEGFGLPILEASYFNCPIIASNIEVFKEILGSNYLSFNPSSTQDIIDKIQLFLKEDLKFNYCEITKQYSFKIMSEKILMLYKRYA